MNEIIAETVAARRTQDSVSHHSLSSGLRGRKMAAIDGMGVLLRF